MISIQKVGILAGLAGVLCLAGCRTAPKPTYTFFPPPPDEPRIQFLTGFSTETDLGGQSKFSRFVLGRERIQRPILKPYGISTVPGKLYICDTQPANVSVVDLKKRRLRYLRPEGRGALQFPIGVVAEPDGTCYVTDTKRGQVLVYDAEGNLLLEIGKKNEMRPCGIALSGDRLLVTDLTNHCVRVYGNKGHNLLFQIPRNPGDTNAVLRSPTNVAVDRHGRIYVSDTGGFIVQIYDAEGNHLRTLGEMGLEPGRFALFKADQAGAYGLPMHD